MCLVCKWAAALQIYKGDSKQQCSSFFPMVTVVLTTHFDTCSLALWCVCCLLLHYVHFCFLALLAYLNVPRRLFYCVLPASYHSWSKLVMISLPIWTRYPAYPAEEFALQDAVKELVFGCCSEGDLADVTGVLLKLFPGSQAWQKMAPILEFFFLLVCKALAKLMAPYKL